MKADSTIRRELRELRELRRYIDGLGGDPLTKRIAWEIEQAIRWAREDVRDWPRPLESATSAADIIRDEFQRGILR